MARDNEQREASRYATVGGKGGEGFANRYLAAKKMIDDRACSGYVWDILQRVFAETTAGELPRILEVGAGIGTMVERIVERGLLPAGGHYLATDQSAASLQAVPNTLTRWSPSRSSSWHWPREGQGVLTEGDRELTLTLEQVSIEELALRAKPSAPFHLLIAHAILDLVDFSTLLPKLSVQLTSPGLLLLTCNFDGETLFFPNYPGGDEEEILRRYHASMEARVNGASHCGRRLLAFLLKEGYEVLAAGASDWIIHPHGLGYAAEDAFFLHTLVETVTQELASNAPPQGLRAWSNIRHQQIEAGELTCMARHLDLLARISNNTDR